MESLSLQLPKQSVTSMKMPMLPDTSEPNILRPGTLRGALENILQWFAGIVANVNKPIEKVSRPECHPSDFTAENRAEGVAVQVGAVVDESAAAERTSMAPGTGRVTANAKIGQDAQIGRVASTLDDPEIQRRRDLVRTLFNDFWSVSDAKPASFAEKLDQCESYLNQRLAACGEPWRLDAETRELLGLPAQSNLANKTNSASHR
jgi:hypothetical protein